MIEITEEMLDAIEAVKGRRDPKYWDPRCRRYMEKQRANKKKLIDIIKGKSPAPYPSCIGIDGNCNDK